MSLSFSIFIVYLIVFGWGCMIYWRLRGAVVGLLGEGVTGLAV